MYCKILMTYKHIKKNCRDTGGFLEVTLVWIHPIHQNLCRAQWPRVGNNIDSRDNRLVYGYLTLPFKESMQKETVR